MTLVVNSPALETYESEESTFKTSVNEELKIVTSKTFTETSPMPENLKRIVREGSPELISLLKSIVDKKGNGTEDLQIQGNVINANGISSMDIHQFTLEAAKLGKTITYREEKTIIISD